MDNRRQSEFPQDLTASKKGKAKYSLSQKKGVKKEGQKPLSSGGAIRFRRGIVQPKEKGNSEKKVSFRQDWGPAKNRLLGPSPADLTFRVSLQELTGRREVTRGGKLHMYETALSPLAERPSASPSHAVEKQRCV